MQRLVALLVLISPGIASPLQLSHPLWVGAGSGSLSLKRSTSQDASCPLDFLCVQQQCPSQVICPSGLECISFEGTLACAPQGTQWCALNPGTFEAVGCLGGGSCCHGNCYVSDAVCCDNPSVRCSVGTLCNACPSGQKCTTGSTTCAAVGGQSSTSSMATVITPTRPPPISTTTNAITSSKATESSTQPPPVTTTATTAATSTAASGTPTPTIVQTSGNFKYQGCFADSTSSRILVVDSQTDASATGMTVEKCVAFAQSKGLRYAGVEFGSQCFVGNTLHTTNNEPDHDCSQVCAGSKSELCGAGGRLQVYLDTTWFDPTLEQLTSVLEQYNSSIAQLRDTVGQYHDFIIQWKADHPSQKRSGALRGLFKRTPVQTLTQLRSQAQTQFQTASEAATNGGVLYLRGGTSDLVRPGQTNPFVDPPTLNTAQQAFEMPLQPLQNTISRISSDIQTISEAGSETPILDVATDLSVSEGSINVLGTIVAGQTLKDIAKGTGAFALLATVFLALQSEGDSGGPSPTSSAPAPTSSGPESSTAACPISASASISAADLSQMAAAATTINGTTIPLAFYAAPDSVSVNFTIPEFGFTITPAPTT